VISACDPETQFRCGSGECKALCKRCDGQRDCLDSSDEYNCSKLYTHCLERAAKLAVQALYVLWAAYPSVCASIRPFVRHTPVLCKNEGTQKDAVFTAG